VKSLGLVALVSWRGRDYLTAAVARARRTLDLGVGRSWCPTTTRRRRGIVGLVGRGVDDHQLGVRIQLFSHADRIALVPVALGCVGDDLATRFSPQAWRSLQADRSLPRVNSVGV
jgi:hypothetical protein